MRYPSNRSDWKARLGVSGFARNARPAGSRGKSGAQRVAIARVSVKVGKAGKAGPHAEYIARMGKYSGIGQSAPAPVPGPAARRHPEKLEACEVGNMPAWAQHDPSVFWRASDEHERCNGSVYREMEIALPRELTPVQRRDLVRAWVEQELGGRHAYQWAIHVPQALDGGDQPHVHLMFSERQVDGIERDPEQYFRRYNSRNPERGGCRKGFQEVAEVHGPARDAARAGQLQALRERWAVACNTALEQAGRPERIDMRSHAVRGLDTQPERKLRPSEWRDPAVQQKVVDFRQAREACVMSAAHVGSLIPDAGAEIINLEAARQRRAALAKQQQREREQREEAERDRRAKDHADQARWLGLTLSDLRTEAVRIRPVDALRLVD
ncbi:MAG: MobA/MobL family protein, partial [Anaerolineales bacterium]